MRSETASPGESVGDSERAVRALPPAESLTARLRLRLARSARAPRLVALSYLTACAAPEPAAWPNANPAADAPAAVIDGDFAEWASAPVAVLDRREGGAGIDFGEVRSHADGEAAYLLVDVGRAVNLQVLGTPLRLVVDLDLDPRTGATTDGVAGADLVVSFSPADSAGRQGQGVVVRRPTDGLVGTAYDIGLIFAPTHASSRFELRIDRAAAAEFAAVPLTDRWRGRWLAEAGGTTPADDTAPFEVTLPAFGSRRGSDEAVGDPLARATDAEARVVTWNVADRSFVERPTSFARVLRALAPDVLLLDELPRTIDEAALRSFLERLDGDWQFALGEGGGRQHAAVASRLRFWPAEELARVDYGEDVAALAPLARLAQTRRDLTTGPADGVSAAGAYVDIEGRPVLFIALDLACCGGAQDVEDRFRVLQAKAIHDAAMRAARSGRVAGVVMGGDFNLVGSRTPLDSLAAALDPNGAPLVSASALQLDGRTATTWRSPGPFPAGRLDYVLFSASSLEAMRAFVFDPADLGARWLERYDLDPADAEQTSDHMPVVVDLRIR